MAVTGPAALPTIVPKPATKPKAAANHHRPGIASQPSGSDARGKAENRGRGAQNIHYRPNAGGVESLAGLGRLAMPCQDDALQAIGCVAPADRLAGREAEIFAARDRKLAEAWEGRKAQREATRLQLLAPSSDSGKTAVTPDLASTPSYGWLQGGFPDEADMDEGARQPGHGKLSRPHKDFPRGIADALASSVPFQFPASNFRTAEATPLGRRPACIFEGFWRTMKCGW